MIKTSERFEFKAQPSSPEPRVRERLRGESLGKKENVLLVGNAGTGQTHLATGLGWAACSLGKRVRFDTTTGLVTPWWEAREERAWPRRQKPLDRQELIPLDELGYVAFSKAGAELLFEGVSRVYKHTRRLDRLTHRVHILEANGASYHLADAKKRLKGA